MDGRPAQPAHAGAGAVRAVLVALTLVAGLGATTSVAGATTLSRVRSAALKATKAERARGGTILFGLRAPLRAHAVIREAGRRPAATGSSRRVMPLVLRVGRERAYLFYLDRGGRQLYEHSGRVVLVGARTGKVVRSRTLRYAPAIDGRLPTFLRSRARYDSSPYRVASRSYSVAGGARAVTHNPLGSFGATPDGALRSAASTSLVATQLAAGKSCTIAVGGATARSAATIGSPSGSASLPLLAFDPTGTQSLAAFVASEAIAKRGCRDILVAISGDADRSSATPATRTSLSTSGSHMREYHVTAAMLAAIVGANPSVTFDLMIDAPGSGAYIPALRSLANVALIATSSAAGQTAYRYLPSKRVAGKLTPNPLRRQTDSSFFTTQLFGAATFAASDVEATHAATEVAAHRAPSFLAYLIARGFALSRPFDFTADLGATQQLYVHGFTPTAPTTPTQVNRAPGATPQVVTATEDTPKPIVLAGSDPDGDALTFAVASAPAHGTLTGTAPNLTYTPAPNYDGPDAFTFTVSDGALISAAATVSITVGAVDDPPVAVADSATVPENAGAVAVAVLANDTDVDGGPKSIVSATQPAHGTVAIAAGGTGLTYAPAPNYCNSHPPSTPDTFTYALNGGSSATVSMTVTCPDIAPTAVDDTFTAAKSAVGNTALVVDAPGDGPPPVGGPHKSTTGDILANDTDPDGPNALTVLPGTFATNDGGSVTIQSDGDFVFTPAAGTSCTDSSDFFDYTVTDGNPGMPGTDVGRVTIAITGCVWYVDNDATGNSGTSSAPFDTLAQAQAASSAGDTIFVERGDGTSGGQSAGIDLKANQRLIGAAATLQVGSDVLQAGVPANRPTIGDSGADAVALATGDTVSGVQIDPAGAGSAIAGGAGDAGATIDDVKIVDAGTPGTQPEFELDGTSGTFDISDLTVDGAAGAEGVRLDNNSGVVNFASAGTNSITTSGAKALDVTSTNMGAGSVFDDITATGSPSGAVSIVNATGATTLGDGAGSDLDLQTTSGATAAFLLNNAGTVTVPAGGTANVSATGGPAVDVSATSGPSLAFDSVSSAASAGAGISLSGLGSGTFSASGGTLAGFAGTAFSVDGGSGAIGYAGAIGDGAGNTALIASRTGGSVTLSGNIADGADANGGVSVSNDSGGSTVLSGAAKTFSTGAGPAISMTSSSGHTLSITGGGLAIATTSGTGLTTSAGTLDVTGAANTIASTTGTALAVDNTTIDASNVTFQRISSNGAPQGLRLDHTGTSGRLVVTGSGGTCTAADTSGCSGGQIAAAAGADDATATPAGTGIVLDDTLNPAFTRMWIHDSSNYAIRGHDVAGFALDTSVVDGTNGSNDAPPYTDGSVVFDNLSGAAAISNSAISGGYADNVQVVNASGSLDRLTLSNDTIGDNDATNGNDALSLQSTPAAGALKASILDSTFTGARGALVDYDHEGSGSGDLVASASHFSDDHPGIATGGGGLTLMNGGASGPTTMSLNGNTFRDADGAGILAVKLSGSSTQSGSFEGNTLGVAGVANSGSAEGSGLKLQTVGQGTSTWTVTGNQIHGYNNNGIEVEAGGGASAQSGALNATITGNLVDQPGTTAGTLSLPKNAIQLNVGTVPGDTYQACAVIGGAGALANSLASGGADGVPAVGGGQDVRLRQRQSTTIRLPGYGGAATDLAAVQSFVAADNPGGGPSVIASASSPPGGGYTGTGTSCP